jgi:hypothetical protein
LFNNLEYKEFSRRQISNNRIEGDWVGFNAHLEIAGVHHRVQNAHLLVKSLTKGMRFKTSLMREPKNKFDVNAMAIRVKVKQKFWYKDLLIGYVPADTAEYINSIYKASMPISAEVVKVRYNRNSTFITIGILIPKASERKLFEI